MYNEKITSSLNYFDIYFLHILYNLFMYEIKLQRASYCIRCFVTYTRSVILKLIIFNRLICRYLNFATFDFCSDKRFNGRLRQGQPKTTGCAPPSNDSASPKRECEGAGSFYHDDANPSVSPSWNSPYGHPLRITKSAYKVFQKSYCNRKVFDKSKFSLAQIFLHFYALSTLIIEH